MYQGFYGLRELPFELTPNPKFLYLTSRHREALSNLNYAFASGKSITLLVGEAVHGQDDAAACRAGIRIRPARPIVLPE